MPTPKQNNGTVSVVIGTRPAKWGFVYLFEFNGLHKIGISKDVDSRLEQCKTANPFIREHLRCPVSSPREIEKELHKHFASKRVAREWFKLDSVDLEMVDILLKPLII